MVHSKKSFFFFLNCLCVSGGDEPREAQLGAPQRGPPRPDHSGGHTQPRQDQTPAGHQRGQETSRARCEYQYSVLRTEPREKLCDWIRVRCVGMHGRGKGDCQTKSVCVYVCVCAFFCVCLCVYERVCVKG